MAANMSWSAFGKATELRQRIFFTLGLLIVYRLGTYIPVPGIDAQELRNFFDQASTGLGGILDMFTGGAISRMGLFALGIMPYISASIIIQLLTAMVPQLEQLKKEGEQGPKKSTSTPATAPSFWPRFRPTVWRCRSRRAIWRWIRAGISAPPPSSRWSAAPCS